MKVIVTAGTQMTNPIGDGHDYGPGETLEVGDATGEAWIRRGWVCRYTRPQTTTMNPRTDRTPTERTW